MMSFESMPPKSDSEMHSTKCQWSSFVSTFLGSFNHFIAHILHQAITGHSWDSQKQQLLPMSPMSRLCTVKRWWNYSQSLNRTTLHQASCQGLCIQQHDRKSKKQHYWHVLLKRKLWCLLLPLCTSVKAWGARLGQSNCMLPILEFDVVPESQSFQKVEQKVNQRNQELACCVVGMI